MVTGDATKWASLAGVVAALAAAIGWGAWSWEPTDFYELHDFVGPGLALTMAIAVGTTTQVVTRIFPSTLRKSEHAEIVVVAILCIGVFVAVVASGLGINKLGPRPVPREVPGKLTHFAVQKGSGSKKSRTFAIFQLENDQTIRVHKTTIDELHLKVGDTVPVLVYRGNLLDWGLLQMPQASSNAR